VPPDRILPLAQTTAPRGRPHNRIPREATLEIACTKWAADPFPRKRYQHLGQRCANRALGLRERLGDIPLLIDDVTRDKFTSHVPDLVRPDQEMSAQ
jgi:hypothetical protein